MNRFILLENSKTNLTIKNSRFFYEEYAEIICHHPADLAACFAKIMQLQQQGKFLAGFINYEAGYYLQPKNPKCREKKKLITLPLLHFLAFTKCDELTPAEVESLLSQLSPPQSPESFIYNLNLSFSEAEYFAKLAQIKAYLRAGHTYQVNLTAKYHFNFQGDPLAFYKILREQQRVEYAGFLNFGTYQILSLSPELFFKKTEQQLLTKPMKGTIARGMSAAQDKKNKEFLPQDAKSRAENLMIVDLIRNDIGKIATTGSVQVKKLFAVESFETVHQMISEIAGTVPVDITLMQLFRALFPCGSVTGAPKLRTMEIINDLETVERGIYTGAIGYLLPENNMCFNVPIRTVILQGNSGELGVGGGILYDSDKEQEFAEVKLKAKFLTAVDPGFELVECFFYSPAKGYRNITQHLRRLMTSAQMFNFVCSNSAIVAALKQYKKNLSEAANYKIKLQLNKKGNFKICHEVINDATTAEVKIIISPDTVLSNNILLQHKTNATSVRGLYDAAYKELAQLNNYFDVIFQNEHGHITEGTRSNIFIELDNKILTPPVTAGLLPGIMWQNFINDKKNVREENFTYADMCKASQLWVMNSVRGVMSAKLR